MADEAEAKKKNPQSDRWKDLASIFDIDSS